MKPVEPETPATLVKGYTVALWTIAVFFLISMIVMRGVGGASTTPETDRWIFEYTSNLMLALGLVTGWIAWLRTKGSEYAVLATAVFSFAIAIYFPFGTAVTVYWFLKVRRIESAV